MKTLRVTLADIVGPTGTPNSTATVHARYVDTSGRGRDVHLTDGTIVVPVRRVASPDGDPEVFDFDVYANDVAPVREVDYGHLVEVSWTVVAPTGAKSSGVKRVQITDSMASVVQLGLLAQPTPVPPYTGGYALAPDLAAEVATRAAADAALDAALVGKASTAHGHVIADTTGLQAALDGKAATSHTHTASQVSDSTTTGRALLTATDAAAARTTLALGTAATTAATAYATAVQGGKADSALQPTTVTGLLAGNGTTTTGRTITGTADEITVTNGSGASGNPTLSLALTAAKVGALPIPDAGAYYPTDTIDAALQLIGGRERYGTGSPEGVVTADVGTYYNDTAGTNGAWRWQKTSGAGNTGWSVIIGNTGWRTITSWTTGAVVTGQALNSSSWAPTASSAGYIRVCRTVDTVLVAIVGLDRTATTDIPVWSGGYVLPTGYRPFTVTVAPSFHATGNIAMLLGSDGSLGRGTGGLVGVSGSVGGGAALVIRGPVVPGSGWPSSMPGTAYP